MTILTDDGFVGVATNRGRRGKSLASELQLAMNVEELGREVDLYSRLSKTKPVRRSLGTPTSPSPTFHLSWCSSRTREK